MTQVSEEHTVAVEPIASDVWQCSVVSLPLAHLGVGPYRIERAETSWARILMIVPSPQGYSASEIAAYLLQELGSGVILFAESLPDPDLLLAHTRIHADGEALNKQLIVVGRAEPISASAFFCRVLRGVEPLCSLQETRIFPRDIAPWNTSFVLDDTVRDRLRELENCRGLDELWSELIFRLSAHRETLYRPDLVSNITCSLSGYLAELHRRGAALPARGLLHLSRLEEVFAPHQFTPTLFGQWRLRHPERTQLYQTMTTTLESLILADGGNDLSSEQMDYAAHQLLAQCRELALEQGMLSAVNEAPHIESAYLRIAHLEGVVADLSKRRDDTQPQAEKVASPPPPIPVQTVVPPRKSNLLPWFKILALPLISAWSMVLAVVYGCRALLSHRAHDVSGYIPFCAVNYLWYYNLALNYTRFGRYSPRSLFGGGELDLRTLFFQREYSLRFTRWVGQVAVNLIGFAVLAGTLMVVSNAGWEWTATVVLLSLTGSLAYGTFLRQNYTMLSWAIMPVLVAALVNGQPLPAALALFLMNIVSFTGLVIGGFFVALAAVVTLDPIYLLIPLPAVVYAAWPLFYACRVGGTIAFVARAIGASRDARYPFPPLPKMDVVAWNTLLTWSLPLVVALYEGTSPLIVAFGLAPAALFILNYRIARFADEQTIWAVAIIVNAIITLAVPPSWYALVALLFAMNKPWWIMSMRNQSYRPWKNWHTKPVVVTRILDTFHVLLNEVPSGARVLMPHADPEGSFSKLFAGAQGWIEALHYVATQRGVVLYPDYFFVWARNKPSDPADYWGTDPAKAFGTVKRYGADYLIIHGPEPIDATPWELHGATLVTRADLRECYREVDFVTKHPHVALFRLASLPGTCEAESLQ